MRSGTVAKPTYVKVEGAAAKGLRTGQKVRVNGRVLSAANGAKKQRFQATSVSVTAEPSRPPRTRSASGEAHRNVFKAASGTRAAPQRRLLQGQLPTSKLPVVRTDVNTLILPISFEGCPSPGGGTYSAPWYTTQVSGGHAALASPVRLGMGAA